MPTGMLTSNDRVDSEVLPAAGEQRPVSAEDDVVRAFALKHIEDVRKLKMRALEFLLVLAALVPVWIVTQYQDSGGWPERLSSQSNPGDWDPWILWVALVGGVILGITAVRTYFSRPTTEAEIEQEIERMRRTRR